MLDEIHTTTDSNQLHHGGLRGFSGVVDQNGVWTSIILMVVVHSVDRYDSCCCYGRTATTAGARRASFGSRDWDDRVQPAIALDVTTIARAESSWRLARNATSISLDVRTSATTTRLPPCATLVAKNELKWNTTQVSFEVWRDCTFFAKSWERCHLLFERQRRESSKPSQSAWQHLERNRGLLKTNKIATANSKWSQSSNQSSKKRWKSFPRQL